MAFLVPGSVRVPGAAGGRMSAHCRGGRVGPGVPGRLALSVSRCPAWHRQAHGLVLMRPGEGKEDRCAGCDQDHGGYGCCDPGRRSAQQAGAAGSGCQGVGGARGTKCRQSRDALLLRVDRRRYSHGQVAADPADRDCGEAGRQDLELEVGAWRCAGFGSGQPPDRCPPLARVSFTADHGDGAGFAELQVHGKVLVAAVMGRSDELDWHRHGRYSESGIAHRHDGVGQGRLPNCLSPVDSGHGLLDLMPPDAAFSAPHGVPP
jgi:hypothetical protein